MQKARDSHAGQELIHVLAGTFAFALDGRGPETLHAGDSAYFDSTRQHRWRNPGRQPAVLLWMNTDADRLSILEPKLGAVVRSILEHRSTTAGASA